jgi:hypothetical protein
MFFDSEQRPYPIKQGTRAIGNIIIKYTGYPKSIDEKKKKD